MDSEHWKKVVEIAAIIGGVALGGGLIIKLAIKFTSKKNVKSNKVVQKNIRTGGDNAGRDINK